MVSNSLMLTFNYLNLYIFILLAAAANIIAYILRTHLRKTHNSSEHEFPSLSAYEIAYLAGGQQRAIDTAIVGLVQHGYLQAYPETRALKLKATLPKDCFALETEISHLVRFNGSISQITTSVTHATFPIYKRLINLGLLISIEQAKSLQFLSVLPIFVLIIVGMGMIILDLYQGRPVSLLVLLCMIAITIGFSFLSIPIHRSLEGDRILKNLRTTNSFTNTEDDSQLMAFALFGAGVLANSPLNDLRQVLVSRFSFDNRPYLLQCLSYAAALF
ncbi:TIGR04222 domain-containing membrane protein [Chlorogloeopsis sp. ULAP01]|uniref:TIGR04222 domain-containing membrane protein n=1 Tax=Chlorogloeopsis sp. ULAP01 TaxID=3056483 RepID=UPI0025AA4DFA|nr:TIGR04222 domain-containing membrane protein [Chlorogloeopsis sp. ULAP01]MDM9379132.1 TIGR04222 domain-containing membrane protein [Chlorogloeopsis sp. ULAP01]